MLKEKATIISMIKTAILSGYKKNIQFCSKKGEAAWTFIFMITEKLGTLGAPTRN
jgi:hypothetical protein